MIDITKIAAIGLIGTFLTIAVKQQKPEIAIATALATGAVILYMIFPAIFSAVNMLKELCAKTGIEYVFLETILKIIGVSYITQLASSVANDSGQNAIAMKIDFAGKVCIILLSIPILMGIVDLLVGMVN
jgi:stage III sporulation protein AD